MSVRTMILRGGKACRIEHETSTVGVGAALTKTWVAMYSGVPILLNALSMREAAIIYERFQVMAQFKGFIEYRANIAEAACRVKVDTRIFRILKVDNYDEKNIYLRLLLEEFKNT
jgi:head-tail adaptor